MIFTDSTISLQRYNFLLFSIYKLQTCGKGRKQTYKLTKNNK